MQGKIEAGEENSKEGLKWFKVLTMVDESHRIGEAQHRSGTTESSTRSQSLQLLGAG